MKNDVCMSTILCTNETAMPRLSPDNVAKLYELLQCKDIFDFVAPQNADLFFFMIAAMLAKCIYD